MFSYHLPFFNQKSEYMVGGFTKENVYNPRHGIAKVHNPDLGFAKGVNI